MRVTAARGAPLHMNDPGRNASGFLARKVGLARNVGLARKVGGEQLEADIDDTRRRGEQAFRVFAVLRVHGGLCVGRRAPHCRPPGGIRTSADGVAVRVTGALQTSHKKSTPVAPAI
jgi:hypothetical protein